MRRQPLASGITLWTFLAALTAVPVLAQSSPAITVSNAWARRAAGGHGQGETANGAAYLTITNRGTESDAIVSATSDAAKVAELHEVRNEGGVMAMRPLARLPLPAGGALEMKPGGYHVMLLGLTRDLQPGGTVKINLTFEKAPPMAIEVLVR